MKKQLLLVALIIAIAISSCASRKVRNEITSVKKEIEIKSVEKEQSDSISNIKKEIVTYSSHEGSVVTEVITITPIDPNKEATIKDSNGISVAVNNAVYRIDRMIKKDNKQLKQGIKEQQIAIKKKVSNASFERHAKEKIDNHAKFSEKKQFNYSCLLLLIIPLIGGVYLFYRNNPTSKMFNLFKR